MRRHNYLATRTLGVPCFPIGSTEAIKRVMRTLRMDGARKMMLGLTTPEEVMMVTAESD